MLTAEKKEFPYQIRKLDEKHHEKVVKVFLGQPDGFVQIGHEKFVMPEKFSEFAEKIYNFKARPDDVFICTFPRSGTTWTQEMIWLICNNLDYKTALSTKISLRFPFLEFNTLRKSVAAKMSNEERPMVEKVNLFYENIYDTLEKMETRRFIKTHLPFSLMPRNIREVGAKVVYVARNPKDVAVSYYHFHKHPVLGFTEDFESFVQYFMDDLVINGPYWKHIIEGWNHQNDENVHFMFYENSKFDLKNSLKKLAEFLDEPLKDEDVPGLMKHLQFENVKENPSINYKFNSEKNNNGAHVRRGLVGGNPEMTIEISHKFDVWGELNLSGLELKFPHC